MDVAFRSIRLGIYVTVSPKGIQKNKALICMQGENTTNLREKWRGTEFVADGSQVEKVKIRAKSASRYTFVSENSFRASRNIRNKVINF